MLLKPLDSCAHFLCSLCFFVSYVFLFFVSTKSSVHVISPHNDQNLFLRILSLSFIFAFSVFASDFFLFCCYFIVNRFFSGFYFNRELFHSVIMCSWLVYLKEIESTFCYFLFRWVSRSLAFGFLLNTIFLRSFNLFDGKWQRQSKIFHPQMPKQDFI